MYSLRLAKFDTLATLFDPPGQETRRHWSTIPTNTKNGELISCEFAVFSLNLNQYVGQKLAGINAGNAVFGVLILRCSRKDPIWSRSHQEDPIWAHSKPFFTTMDDRVLRKCACLGHCHLHLQLFSLKTDDRIDDAILSHQELFDLSQFCSVHFTIPYRDDWYNVPRALGFSPNYLIFLYFYDGGHNQRSKLPSLRHELSDNGG